MQVELDIIERKKTSGNSAKQARREGFIPVVVYSKGQAGKSGCVSKDAVAAALRNVQEGFLPTTTFLLKDESGKVTKALIKDIQYHVTSYDVLHLDFIELHDDHKVEVKVPVECRGTVDCVGVKAGGYLRQVMRHVKLRCLPKNIPHHFDLDVQDLNIGHAKRVQDLQMPANVEALVPSQEVIITVVK